MSVNVGDLTAGLDLEVAGFKRGSKEAEAQLTALKKLFEDLFRLTGRGLDLETSKFKRAAAEVEHAGSGIKKVLGEIFKLAAGFEVSRIFEQAILSIKQFVSEAVKMGYEANITEEAFAQLTRQVGVSADALVAQLKRASGETINTSDILRSASKGLLQGLQPEQLVKVMELARSQTLLTGQTVQEGFNAISEAIANQQVRQLKYMGIVIDVQHAVDSFAKAHGRSAEALTEVGRAHAIMAKVLEVSKGKMLDVTGEAARQRDTVERLRAQWNEFKEVVGKFAISAGFGVVEWATKVVTLLPDIGTHLQGLGAAWSTVWSGMGRAAKALFGDLVALFSGYVKDFAAGSGVIGELWQAVWGTVKAASADLFTILVAGLKAAGSSLAVVVSGLGGTLVPILKAAAVAAAAFGVGLTAGFSVIAGPLAYISSMLSDMAEKKWPNHKRATIEANEATMVARQRLAEAGEAFENLTTGASSSGQAVDKYAAAIKKADAAGKNALGDPSKFFRSVPADVAKANAAIADLTAKLAGIVPGNEQFVEFQSLVKPFRELFEKGVISQGLMDWAEGVANVVAGHNELKRQIEATIAGYQALEAVSDAANDAMLQGAQQAALERAKFTQTGLDAQLKALEQETFAALLANIKIAMSYEERTKAVADIYATDAAKRAQIVIGSAMTETELLTGEWSKRIGEYVKLLEKGEISQAKFEEAVRHGAAETEAKLIASFQRTFDARVANLAGSLDMFKKFYADERNIEAAAQAKKITDGQDLLKRQIDWNKTRLHGARETAKLETELLMLRQEKEKDYFGFLGSSFRLAGLQAGTFFDDLKRFGTEVYDGLRRATSDFFYDWITGASSASDAFKKFGQSILRTLTDLMANTIVREAWALLFGQRGTTGVGGAGGGGGGTGGILGSVGGAGLAALLGGSKEGGLLGAGVDALRKAFPDLFPTKGGGTIAESTVPVGTVTSDRGIPSDTIDFGSPSTSPTTTGSDFMPGSGPVSTFDPSTFDWTSFGTPSFSEPTLYMDKGGVVPGQPAMFTDNTLVTGGIPGVDSVPIMAQAGERVLSVVQNRALEAAGWRFRDDGTASRSIPSDVGVQFFATGGVVSGSKANEPVSPELMRATIAFGPKAVTTALDFYNSGKSFQDWVAGSAIGSGSVAGIASVATTLAGLGGMLTDDPYVKAGLAVAGQAASLTAAFATGAYGAGITAAWNAPQFMETIMNLLDPQGMANPETAMRRIKRTRDAMQMARAFQSGAFGVRDLASFNAFANTGFFGSTMGNATASMLNMNLGGGWANSALHWMPDISLGPMQRYLAAIGHPGTRLENGQIVSREPTLGNVGGVGEMIAGGGSPLSRYNRFGDPIENSWTRTRPWETRRAAFDQANPDPFDPLAKMRRASLDPFAFEAFTPASTVARPVYTTELGAQGHVATPYSIPAWGYEVMLRDMQERVTGVPNIHDFTFEVQPYMNARATEPVPELLASLMPGGSPFDINTLQGGMRDWYQNAVGAAGGDMSQPGNIERLQNMVQGQEMWGTYIQGLQEYDPAVAAQLLAEQAAKEQAFDSWQSVAFNTAAGGLLVAGGVPGVDSVPVLAQQNERVLSVEQNRAVEAAGWRFHDDGTTTPPIAALRAAGVQFMANGGLVYPWMTLRRPPEEFIQQLYDIKDSGVSAGLLSKGGPTEGYAGIGAPVTTGWNSGVDVAGNPISFGNLTGPKMGDVPETWAAPAPVLAADSQATPSGGGALEPIATRTSDRLRGRSGSGSLEISIPPNFSSGQGGMTLTIENFWRYADAGILRIPEGAIVKSSRGT